MIELQKSDIEKLAETIAARILASVEMGKETTEDDALVDIPGALKSWVPPAASSTGFSQRRSSLPLGLTVAPASAGPKFAH